MDIIWALLIAVIFLVFGVYASLQILCNIQALQWIKVPGEVVYAEITRNRDVDWQRVYHANIEYRYTVKGVEYFSDRYAFGYSGSKFKFFAKRLVNQYPPYSAVQVRVNPSKHNEAVLVAGLIGSHGKSLIFILLAIAILFGSLFRVLF